MKYFLLIIVIITLTISNFVITQVTSDDFPMYCEFEQNSLTPFSTDCNNSTETFLEKYRTPSHWIPDSDFPVKTVMINWIVCRDDDGENGWTDTQEFRDQVDLMFVKINEHYSESLPPSYYLTCPPTKYSACR